MRLFRLLAPLTLIAVVALALAACGSSNDVGGDVIARVGDEPITKQQFDAEYKQASASMAQTQDGKEMPKAEQKRLRELVLERLVMEAEIRQEAEKLKITVDEKKVTQQYNQQKDACCKNDDRKWKATLRQSGTTEQGMMDGLRRQVLIQAVYEQVTKSAKPSQEEMRSFYEANKTTAFLKPKTRVVAYALFGASTPGVGTPTSKEAAKARDFISRVEGGEDFIRLAIKESTDPSAKSNNATIEVADTDSFDPAFRRAAFALGTGEMTLKPVKSKQFGYFVIKALEDEVPSHQQTYEEAKADVERSVLQQTQGELAQKWFEKVQASYFGKLKFAAGYGLPKNSPFLAKVETTATGS